MRLTGNRDENWPDICRNKSDRRLLCMHRNNRDCVHGPADDSMDVVVSYWPVEILRDYRAVESMPESTTKSKRKRIKNKSVTVVFYAQFTFRRNTQMS